MSRKVDKQEIADCQPFVVIRAKPKGDEQKEEKKSSPVLTLSKKEKGSGERDRECLLCD